MIGQIKIGATYDASKFFFFLQKYFFILLFFLKKKIFILLYIATCIMCNMVNVFIVIKDPTLKKSKDYTFFIR